MQRSYVPMNKPSFTAMQVFNWALKLKLAIQLLGVTQYCSDKANCPVSVFTQ